MHGNDGPHAGAEQVEHDDVHNGADNNEDGSDR
jgi:hypothetical protein